MRTVAIIQARVTSTRLPDKVMKKLAGKPMLSHVIERTKAIVGIDAIGITIPDSNENYRIFDLCDECYVSTGPENDLVRRYQIAADLAGADRIIRITSDCPLLDPVVATEVLAFHEVSGAPYASNIYPQRTYPDGLDVEVMTREALDGLTEPDEHCTTKLRVPGAPCWTTPISLGSYKWSVDTPEEFKFVQAVMTKLPPGKYRMIDTLMAIRDAGVWRDQPQSQDWANQHGA